MTWSGVGRCRGDAAVGALLGRLSTIALALAVGVAGCVYHDEGIPGATSGSGGVGGSEACSPGDTVTCYTGPAGTENVGICKSGSKTCGSDGVFGECTGEVTPKTEDCTTPEDEDCDGKAFSPLDDDCACEPGTMSACYNGPVGTVGFGPCKSGSHVCNADGKTFGDCSGEVTPMPEDCTTPEDEDCNGKVFDDTAAGCVCEPGTTSACDTGALGVCQQGTHTCNADGKGFDSCVQVNQLGFDDCSTPEDEDCDGTAPACTGAPALGSELGNNGATDEVAFAVAVDTSGNSVVGGVWGGVASGYNVTAGSAFVRKVNAQGAEIFLKTYSPGASPNFAAVRGIGTDAAGNIYIGGEYRGTMDLGGGGSCNLGASNVGSTDLFIAKLNAGGACQWGKKVGDGGYQAVTALAVDLAGNVFVTGGYSGSINFGAGSCNLLGASGTGDMFAAKFDSNGNCKWGKKAGDNTNSGGFINQIGWGIAVTPQGDAVVTGTFDGAIDFGGGALNAQGIDAFVVKLNGNDASLLWAKRYGDGQDQYGFGVAVDPGGNIAVTGTFYGQIDFGNGPLSNADVNNNNADIFLARLDANGGALWSKRFGDTNNQTPFGVAVDGAGNVVLAGHFKGTLNFGGANLVNTNDASNDVFVAKFKANAGEHLWSARYGDAVDQRCWSVAVDGKGNNFLAGGYQGTIDFGAPVGPFTSGGGYDVFQVQLAP